jgi:AraC-like DNA-binding protein
MTILKYEPRSRLRECVELFWLRDNSEPVHAEKREAILPDGRPHLVINLSEDAVRVFPQVMNASCDTLDGSVFCGAHSSPYAILPTAAVVIGVHFRAGGAYPLLRMPAEELHDFRIPLAELYGSAAAELREQLLDARSAAARFAILERFLLRRLQGSHLLHRAVRYAVSAFEHDAFLSVAGVLGKIGLSERRFSQVFSEQVGLTPKLFQRVRRFQRTMASMPSHGEVDWAGTASANGYYDQAHLINDFRAFSSVTPSEFFASRILQRNHLPLRS